MAYRIKKIHIKTIDYIVKDNGVSAIIDPINDKLDDINDLLTEISNLIDNISGRLSTAENRIRQL